MNKLIHLLSLLALLFIASLGTQGSTQAQSTAPQAPQAQITLSGELNQPGRLTYVKGMRLVDAIIAAGDMNDYASRYIQLTRAGQATITLDIYTKEQRETKLQPGDVIYVPRRAYWHNAPAS